MTCERCGGWPLGVAGGGHTWVRPVGDTRALARCLGLMSGSERVHFCSALAYTIAY